MHPQGLQQIFEENREPLLRYLRAHGAGEAAEDLLQELWLKISASPPGPIAAPRNYLFRAATNLMIDRRRGVAAGRPSPGVAELDVGLAILAAGGEKEEGDGGQ